MFTIYVNTVDGSTMSFLVSHDTTITEVKDQIHDCYPVGGMPAHTQRLMFAGDVLGNRHSMADYNITAGATIIMAKWPYDGFNIGCDVTAGYQH